MPDFDTWLEETKAKISAINLEISNVKSLLNDSLQIVNDIDIHSKDLQNAFKKTSKDSYFVANDNLRTSLHQLAFIGHDAETIISLDYFLSHYGFNLHKIFNDINEGPIHIKQNSIALIEEKSNHCVAINNGYLGLIIPTTIKIANLEFNIELAITFYLNQSDSTNFNLKVANVVQYCPEDTFNLRQSIELINLAQPKVEASLKFFSYPLDGLNINNQSPIFYGTTLYKNQLRIFASFGLRHKRKMRLLNGPQDGFHILIKLGNEFIRNAIVAEVNRNGLVIQGEPKFNGSDSFILSLMYTQRDRVKVGCIRIPYKIVVAGNVTIRLTLKNREQIVVSVEKLTEPQIIEASVAGIPLGIIEFIKVSIINLFLRRFKITLNFKMELDAIKMNQRDMAFELTSEFLILKLAM